jgi:hypothetical protein
MNRNSAFLRIGQANSNQENLKHNTPSVLAAGKPGGKAHILLLLLLSGLVFFSTTVIFP